MTVPQNLWTFQVHTIQKPETWIISLPYTITEHRQLLLLSRGNQNHCGIDSIQPPWGHKINGGVATASGGNKHPSHAGNHHTGNSLLLSHYPPHLQCRDTWKTRGRRRNLQVRGVPKSIKPEHINLTLTTIFNKLFDRPTGTPITLEMAHRARGPRRGDAENPHMTLFAALYILNWRNWSPKKLVKKVPFMQIQKSRYSKTYHRITLT